MVGECFWNARRDRVCEKKSLATEANRRVERQKSRGASDCDSTWPDVTSGQTAHPTPGRGKANTYTNDGNMV